MEHDNKREAVKGSRPKVNLSVSVGEGHQHASSVARPGEIAMAVSISTGTGTGPQAGTLQDDPGRVIDLNSRRGKERAASAEDEVNL